MWAHKTCPRHDIDLTGSGQVLGGLPRLERIHGIRTVDTVDRQWIETRFLQLLLRLTDDLSIDKTIG